MLRWMQFSCPRLRDIYISSSLVREIAVYGGDVSDFVDPKVCEALKNRFKNPRSKTLKALK